MENCSAGMQLLISNAEANPDVILPGGKFHSLVEMATRIMSDGACKIADPLSMRDAETLLAAYNSIREAEFSKRLANHLLGTEVDTERPFGSLTVQKKVAATTPKPQSSYDAQRAQYEYEQRAQYDYERARMLRDAAGAEAQGWFGSNLLGRVGKF